MSTDGTPEETPRDPAAEGTAPPPADAPDAAPEPAADSPDRQDEAAYQAATGSSPLGYVFLLGVAGLLCGLAWRQVEGETGVATAAWIFVSALLALAPLPWHAVDWFHAVATRRGGAFANVLVTVLLGGFVMVVVSAMNVVVKEHPDRLPEAIRHRALDLTESGRYTLGEETEKILRKIESTRGTVYATYLKRPGPGSTTSDELRQMVLEQLRVYGYRCARIVVADFDDYRENDAAQKYLASKGAPTRSSSTRTDVIVLTWAEADREVQQGKQKEIPVDEYAFAKPGGEGSSPRWLGERVITSAIQELAFVKLRAYAIGGHGGPSLAEDLRDVRERLQAQNVDVVDRPLDLSGGSPVPDDCDLLLVFDPDPKVPFEPQETAAISRWLDRGRSLFLCLDVHKEAERRETGLEPLLAGYGIVPKPQFIVVAPFLTPVAGGQAIWDMRTTMIARKPDYASHPAIEPLRRGNGFPVIFFESIYLDVKSDLPEGVESDVIVWAPDIGRKDVTPPFAALVSNARRADLTAADPATDVSGVRLPLIACATKSLPADATGAKRDARVVVCGDTHVFAPIATQQNASNLDLFGGLAQWALRRSDLAAVSDKTLDLEIADIDDHDHRLAFWWPLVTALMALLAGAAVWWSRRR